MRKTGILWLVALSVACNEKSPTSPTAVADEPIEVVFAEMRPVPKVHNLPVSFEGEETDNFPIYYVCATQPRGYADKDGKNGTLEIDYYISRNRCPDRPID